MNEKITTVRMPGRDTGITVRQIAPIRLYPSIIACSSISHGTLLKNPIISQVQNGIVNVG